MWNSVGGKIEDNETHLEAAIRETYEETGIKLSSDRLLYLADLKWYFEESEEDGAYCYLANIDEKEKNHLLITPLKTREGILDWKKIDWVLDKENRGIVPDIFNLLSSMLSGTFRVITAYYNKEDKLSKIETEEGEKMDNLKENLKKAGYAAVGAGATVYEKVAPAISKFADKVINNIGEKYDTYASKGEEILKKKKSQPENE